MSSNPSSAAGTLSSQVSAHLTSKHLPPKDTWLSQFLSSQRPTTPLPALKQTALFRLLATDITKTLANTTYSVFPRDILNAHIVERQLPGPIPVQIISVEDVGQSKWNQIEAIEASERGETTKGREIIRVVPGEDSVSDPTGSKGGPHKLLLQDAEGVKVYGFELVDIKGLSAAMSMGAKLVLQNVMVARGVLMLKPDCASLLGGKIEALDKAWKEKRKEILKAAFDHEQA